MVVWTTARRYEPSSRVVASLQALGYNAPKTRTKGGDARLLAAAASEAIAASSTIIRVGGRLTTKKAATVEVTLVEKIAEIVAKSFPDAEARLALNPSGRVYGTVVSETFAALNDVERQHAFYGHLRGALSPKELEDVMLVFTVTPEEDAVIERNMRGAEAGADSAWPKAAARRKGRGARTVHVKAPRRA